VPPPEAFPYRFWPGLTAVPAPPEVIIPQTAITTDSTVFDLFLHRPDLWVMLQTKEIPE
jgi:hypothetical protein